MRAAVVLALAALLSAGSSGCFTGCDQEMEHGGNNEDAAASTDGGTGVGDAGLPFCPDAGPPPDASVFDAGPAPDASPYDAGPTPDAGPPVCRYPWDAGVPDGGAR